MTILGVKGEEIVGIRNEEGVCGRLYYSWWRGEIDRRRVLYSSNDPTKRLVFDIKSASHNTNTAILLDNI